MVAAESEFGLEIVAENVVVAAVADFVERVASTSSSALQRS